MAFIFNPLSGNLDYYEPLTGNEPLFLESAAYDIASVDITNWNTAYGWGNHASVGYLTSLAGSLLATGATTGATSQAQVLTTGAILGGSATKQSTGGPELLSLQGSATNKVLIWGGITTDTNARYLLSATGLMEWGAGVVADQDIALFRNEAGNLTVQSFTANSTNAFRVNQYSADTGVEVLGVDTTNLAVRGASFSSTVSGYVNRTPATFTIDSSYDTQPPALYVKNAANYAHATPLVQFSLLNVSDSGAVLNLANAGSGNYITAGSAFSVSKAGTILATGSLGATGTRLVKGWFTDLESTNVVTVNGAAVYYSGGTDVALADGGTGASLSDPGFNALMGWDDTDNATKFLAIGTGLSYDHASHTLTSTGSGGTVTSIGVTTANGVSGTSSGGTTPSLTIALGAITPTTVNTLTVGLGTNSLATNTAIGVNALAGNNSSSGRNVALGYDSLQDNTSGIGNVATGYLALGNATTGSYNTGVGYQTLSQQIVTGSYNTGVGREALAELTSGSYNTALGYYALGSGNTGSNNVAIGQYAGAYETGSDAFYVDNANRINTAGDKAKALLYGTFNATASSQTLTTNSAFTATYGINIPTGQTYKINNVALAVADITGAAPLASPTFTGTVALGTGPTATSPVFTTDITTPKIITAAGALTLQPASGSGITVTLATTGDFAVNSTQLVVDTSTARVGINQATPSAPFHVGNSTTNNSDDSMILISRNVNDDIAGNGHAFSDSSTITRSGAIGYNSYDAYAKTAGSDGFNHIISFQARMEYGTAATTAAYYGFGTIPVVSAGTVTDLYHYYVTETSGAGTVTNQYGLYVPSLTKGATLNYSIYTAGTTPSSFGGVVSMGTAKTATLLAPSNALAIKPTTNAVTAVQIQDKDGNSVINVDTTNKKTGFGGVVDPGNIVVIPNNKYYTWKNAAGTSETVGLTSSAADDLTLYVGGNRLNITSAGVVTIANLAGTGSRAVLADANGLLSAPVSDERLKKNITPINESLAMDMLQDPNIYAINYQWKDPRKGNDVELGFTAQMFEPYGIKGLTFEDNGIKGLNYDRIVTLLWEQNKILLKRIKKLENK